MPLVNFPAYVTHERGRVEANDAMMALLVGSRLSGHVLSLMDGSDVYLTEAFPRVPGIRRLNVRVPNAQSLLEEAERHIAFMAIPYSISIHEHYLNGCVDMLCAAQEIEPDEVGFNQRKLGNLYATLTELGLSIDSAQLVDLFDLTRRIRNRIVHHQGHVGNLMVHYKSTPSISEGWDELAKRPLDRDSHGRLTLGAGELFAALAILKRLADAVNVSLQQAIPAEQWVKIAVAEYAEEMRPGNPRQTTRRLSGFLRYKYGALDFPWETVCEAADAQGIELT